CARLAARHVQGPNAEQVAFPATFGGERNLPGPVLAGAIRDADPRRDPARGGRRVEVFNEVDRHAGSWRGVDGMPCQGEAAAGQQSSNQQRPAKAGDLAKTTHRAVASASVRGNAALAASTLRKRTART